MKIIQNAKNVILQILSKFYRDSENLRLMQYVVETPAEGGVLLYNLLTFEEVFLTEEEYAHITELEYLKNHWFLIPSHIKEKELAELTRAVLAPAKDNFEKITGYTIFTTTDCNARCFYCFELGRSRIPMSDETAHKVARYICEKSKGEKVHLAWFGGEPLLNQSAADIICKELTDKGVEFDSKAVSNGYLFDEATVEKAISLWKLKRVQITLDGTEAVYNKIKAFVYKDTNPYQIVLANIGHLLKADVAVQIRLNMNLKNVEELIKLVKELSVRFAGQKKLKVYAHHIFEANTPMAESYSEQEWIKLDEAMCRLEECIKENGLASNGGVSKHMKYTYCMADSGKSVTILPDGNIGLCEHHSEGEFIGNIDREGFDEAVVSTWRERPDEIPECDTCFYYPQCIRLKKCSNISVCYAQERNQKLRKIKAQMVNEYQRWLEKSEAEETEDSDNC